jgi:hypothetical protein
MSSIEVSQTKLDAVVRECPVTEKEMALVEAEWLGHLEVAGVGAGTDTPEGRMRVTFSDESELLMSKAQFEAIKAL